MENDIIRNLDIDRDQSPFEGVDFPEEKDGYSVYCITFEDGSAYIGITSLTIRERLERHLWSFNAVDLLVRSGVKWDCQCIASSLTREQALSREHTEVLKLNKPLNAGYPKTHRPEI